MQNHYLRTTTLIAAAALAGMMGGCATQGQDARSEAAKPVAAAEVKVEPKVETKVVPEQNLFLTFHENGRIYVLGDAKLEQIFRETGEVALTRTRIGEGPEGRTLVFGMTKDDAKRGGPTDAEMLYDMKLVPAGSFYGEVARNGRFYVFVEWQDMATYLRHGEVALTYTEVGAGPKGETVVYALNKETAKQGKPVAAIERFHKQHSAAAK
ncbi:MAG: hypothetical protein Q7S85_07385 [Rugosibacter sp.]|nr:hypothetical protein [Rugosibacter sp.]